MELIINLVICFIGSVLLTIGLITGFMFLTIPGVGLIITGFVCLWKDREEYQ